MITPKQFREDGVLEWVEKILSKLRVKDVTYPEGNKVQVLCKGHIKDGSRAGVKKVFQDKGWGHITFTPKNNGTLGAFTEVRLDLPQETEEEVEETTEE